MKAYVRSDCRSGRVRFGLVRFGSVGFGLVWLPGEPWLAPTAFCGKADPAFRGVSVTEPIT